MLFRHVNASYKANINLFKDICPGTRTLDKIKRPKNLPLAKSDIKELSLVNFLKNDHMMIK